jgi:hypothetical protein
VACRWLSLKYAGTVTTAFSIASPKCRSARSFSALRTTAETSGGVMVRSPMRMLTTCSAGTTVNGKYFSSSFTSS